MNISVMQVQQHNQFNQTAKGSGSKKSFQHFLAQSIEDRPPLRKSDAKSKFLSDVQKKLGVKDSDSAHKSNKLASLKDLLNEKAISDEVSDLLAQLLNEEDIDKLVSFLDDLLGSLGEESLHLLSELVDSKELSYLQLISFIAELSGSNELAIDELEDLFKSESLLEEVFNRLYHAELEREQTLTSNTNPFVNHDIQLGELNLFAKLFAQIGQIEDTLQRFEQTGLRQDGRSLLSELQALLRLSQQIETEELSVLLKEAKVSGENEEKLLHLLKSMKQSGQGIASQYVGSQITTADVTNWLAEVNSQLNLQSAHASSQINPGPTFSQQTNMSQIEQFVLHLSDGEDVTTNLSKTLNQNRFFQIGQMLQGNQLTLHLRPDHLGEMVVRFQEINGETVVRLIVASSAAKQLLESNISQLKNMFSPHQVSIEARSESQEAELGQEQEQDQQQEEEQEQREREQKLHEQEEQTVPFQAILDELNQIEQVQAILDELNQIEQEEV